MAPIKRTRRPRRRRFLIRYVFVVDLPILARDDLFTSNKYSLSPDPSVWGSALSPEEREEDDYLHNPHPQFDRTVDKDGQIFTARGLGNLGCLAVLFVGIIALL